MKAEWLGRVSFEDADSYQQVIRENVIVYGNARATVVAAELLPVISLSKRSNIAAPEGVKVISTSRGGLATYHGPGQMVIYPVVKITRLKTVLSSVGQRLCQLAFELFNAEVVWQEAPMGGFIGQDKVISCGIHLKRRVINHGFSINISTPEADWKGLAPCGLSGVRTRPLTHFGKSLTVRDVAPLFLNATRESLVDVLQ